MSTNTSTAPSVFDLNRLDAEERNDLPRATYFMLEAYFDLEETYSLAPIEEAEEEGGYGLHIGLPDRPARRYVIHFSSFEDGLKALESLKQSHPKASMWLSTRELLTEIKGDDIWRGAVNARASHDPTDDDCLWRLFSKEIAGCDATGMPVVVPDDAPSVFDDIARHL